jgi:predicted  nucleic acid-binding Zn-ribbon protein
MAGKKKKALAQDLIDDLLSEEAQGDVADLDITGSSREPSGPPAGLYVATDDNTEAVNDPVAAPRDSLDKTEISHTDISANSIPPMDLSQLAGDIPLDDTEQANDDATMRISDSHVEAAKQPPPAGATKVIAMPPPLSHQQHAPSEPNPVRASVGRFAPFRSSGSGSDAALAQSESLRIAQSRLLEFEQEIERLRTQNEELAAAGETLRRRTDELSAANQKRESDYQHAVSTFEQEKNILIESRDAVQRQLDGVAQKSEELELRISSNIQKIRVRERELENRLELVRMESAALIRSKDEMILDLKRQTDQLNIELNNYRNKNQELNRQTNDKQEMLRRTVKALRLALSMLEGEEENAPGQRKAK